MLKLKLQYFCDLRWRTDSLEKNPDAGKDWGQKELSSSESAIHIRWPKYWSFSFNISPSNEYSGLISFKMEWLDLLAVQGTLRSLLQHHSSRASVLWCSAFAVQLSNSVITGKTIALTIWTFVCRVMSLLYNTLSVCHRFPAKKQSSDFMAELPRKP